MKRKIEDVQRQLEEEREQHQRAVEELKEKRRELDDDQQKFLQQQIDEQNNRFEQITSLSEMTSTHKILLYYVLLAQETRLESTFIILETIFIRLMIVFKYMIHAMHSPLPLFLYLKWLLKLNKMRNIVLI